MAIKEITPGGLVEMVSAEDSWPYLVRLVRENKTKPAKVYYQIRHPMVPVLTGTANTPKPKRAISMPLHLALGDDKFKTLYDQRIAQLEQLRSEQNADEVVEGTVAHLVEVYKAHELWLQLSDSTRANYGKHLDDVCHRWGTFAVNLLDEELAATLRDTIRERSGPIVANTLMAVLANLQKVALEKKTTFMLPQGFNFAKGVRRFGAKQGITPREQIWTDDDEQAFITACLQGSGTWGDPGYIPASRKVLRAYLLMVMTGQRLSDVLNMKVDQFKFRKIKIFDADGKAQVIEDWGISVTQAKRKARVWIRCHHRLREELELFIALNKQSKNPSMYFVSRLDGQPYAENSGGFPKMWRKYQVAAGVGDLQRRDLRRTIVTRLYEVGCSVEQIRDITGHSIDTINDMIEIYGIRTGVAGAAAIIKLEGR